jgi:hypothetical protein
MAVASSLVLSLLYSRCAEFQGRKPNKSVQATAAAHFRFLALAFFIQSVCRSHLSPAAVPDLGRYTALRA